MTEENGTVALESIPPKPSQGMNINLQISQQGVVLSFPVNLGLDNDMMNQLVRAYLQAHPELVQDILKETLAAKQAEMDIIKMVKRSRTDS